MSTLITQGTTIIRQKVYNGYLYIWSDSGLDIYEESTLVLYAYTIIANTTCGDVTPSGIFLGTSDAGLYSSAFPPTGEFTMNLSANTTTTPALVTNNIVDLEAHNDELLMTHANGAMFYNGANVYTYTDANGVTGPAVGNGFIGYSPNSVPDTVEYGSTPSANWSIANMTVINDVLQADDDFNGSSLNADLWSETINGNGTSAVAGGNYTFTVPANQTSQMDTRWQGEFTGPFEATFDIYDMQTEGEDYYQFITFTNDNFSTSHEVHVSWLGSSRIIRRVSGAANSSAGLVDASNDTRIKVIRDANDALSFAWAEPIGAGYTTFSSPQTVSGNLTFRFYATRWSIGANSTGAQLNLKFGDFSIVSGNVTGINSLTIANGSNVNTVTAKDDLMYVCSPDGVLVANAVAGKWAANYSTEIGASFNITDMVPEASANATTGLWTLTDASSTIVWDVANQTVVARTSTPANSAAVSSNGTQLYLG